MAVDNQTKLILIHVVLQEETDRKRAQYSYNGI